MLCCVALSCLVSSCLVLSCLVLSSRLVSSRLVSSLVLSCTCHHLLLAFAGTPLRVFLSFLSFYGWNGWHVWNEHVLLQDEAAQDEHAWNVARLYLDQKLRCKKLAMDNRFRNLKAQLDKDSSSASAGSSQGVCSSSSSSSSGSSSSSSSSSSSNRFRNLKARPYPLLLQFLPSSPVSILTRRGKVLFEPHLSLTLLI